MKICEVCKNEHNGTYGSGRFCSKHCRYVYIGKNAAKSEKHQEALKNNRNKSGKNRAVYGTWKCKFCNIIFETKKQLYLHLHVEHQKSMGTFRNKGGIAWNKGQTKDTNDKIKSASEKLKQRYISGELVSSFLGKHHSNETKNIISQKRKQYLKENPNKHPWKRRSKFRSEPCEKLKQLLKERNLVFSSEFTDVNWNHNYSIDIAFPNNKIGIEVNGNQHYDNNRNLTEYYQNRENYLKSLGWTIYQIYYNNVYNQNLMNDLIDSINEKLKNGF